MSAMSTDRKIRSEWMDSLNNLKTFVTEHGTLPTVPQDRKLHDWVRTQRRLARHGQLGAKKEALLQGFPGIFHFETPPVDRLAEFVAANGRLPGSAAEDPAERALGRYLIFSLRPTVKQGTVSRATLAKAEQIPGAITARRRPDQDAVFAEVKAFAALHGRMPGHDRSGREQRLASWVANNIKGDREKKTPALQKRHDALAELIAKVPGRRWHLSLLRIRNIEDACAANGWKPAGHDDWLRAQAESSGDEILKARIGKILEFPSLRDYQWRKDLAVLLDFEARTGRLPRGWHEGHIYSWLAAQRRDHRSGVLAPWRTILLEKVPDALPKVPRRAA